MKIDRIMPIRWSHAKVAVGLFWAESWLFWSYFFKISTSHFDLPMIYIKIDRQTKSKSIGPKMTILDSKKPHKWPYLNSGFSKVSVTQSLITSATNNIFHDSFCSCWKTKFLRYEWSRIFDLELQKFVSPFRQKFLEA